jgi:hypothetical protein
MGQLELTPTQDTELRGRDGSDMHTNENSQNAPRETERGQEITQEDREMINRWLDDGLVTVHSWMSDIHKIKGYKDSDGMTGFVTVANKALRLPSVLKHKSPIDKQSFVDQGIPEVVTINTIEGTAFGRVVDSQSEKGDEDTVCVTYETLTNGYDNKYRYGKGDFLRLRIFLPRSEAEEMVQAITDKPEVLRQLTESFMTEKLHVGEQWDKKIRPPYEAWRELDNGVSRMAICSEVKIARPDDSKIIEF